MRFAATALLVLLAASAFSAPNPFHPPSPFGGGVHQGYPSFQQPEPQISDEMDAPRVKPKPSDESSSNDDSPAPKPSPPPAAAPGIANHMNDWITMPFRPNVAAPFYVPTIFAPVSTPPVPPPSISITTPFITTTAFPTTIPPIIPRRRSVTIEAARARETPLPTAYARNH